MWRSLSLSLSDKNKIIFNNKKEGGLRDWSRTLLLVKMSQPDFSLSDEILAVIPTDPYEQLDLARKITSMAIASRVSNLESQVSVLTQKLVEKDRIVCELEGRASSLERVYHEADASLKNAVDENVRIIKSE